jgi:hypothetical protein
MLAIPGMLIMQGDAIYELAEMCLDKSGGLHSSPRRGERMCNNGGGKDLLIDCLGLLDTCPIFVQ